MVIITIIIVLSTSFFIFSGCSGGNKNTIIRETYKICSESPCYPWENNNCSIQTILSEISLIFNKPKIINDWLNSDNALLKTLGEILKRFREGDKSKEDYKIFYNKFFNFFCDYYNKNYKDQKLKEEPDKEFKDIVIIFSDFFLKYFCEKLSLEPDKIGFKEIFNSINKIEYKEVNDYCGSFKLKLLIELIDKYYNLKLKHKPSILYEVGNSTYQIGAENFNDVFLIELVIYYNGIGHMALILKKQNKYYFQICNKIYEVEKELVEECFNCKNYQKIIDINTKEGGYDYKYFCHNEYSCFDNKNIDEIYYQDVKNDIFEEIKDGELKCTIHKFAKHYKLPEKTIVKMLKELNIDPDKYK